jgi:hypothetical protein
MVGLKRRDAVGEHPDKTTGRFRPVARDFKDEQRLWREGSFEELKDRIVGSTADTEEQAKGVKKSIE